MSKNNINRRNFIKSSVALILFSNIMPAVTFINEENQEPGFDLDSEYIVINGWVLLKSDVMLD